MATEFVDVLDENGSKTGSIEPRSTIHRDGLWHAAAHVWICSSKGDVMLQLRAKEKMTFPGRLDVSAAGHVDAGETVEEAAVRELKEELGIAVKIDELKLAFVYKNSVEVNPGYWENEFQYVYLLSFDSLPDTLQREEVKSVEFMPLGQFESELNDKRLALHYVPHSYYPRLVEILKEATRRSKKKT